MARTVGIGKQDFEKIVSKNTFYVDKTGFLCEWWENEDDVTLITRPRRFGKTLTMSMVEQFFSVDYAGREDLFENLNVWKVEKYRSLQGTFPVISLSFANVKHSDYSGVRQQMNLTLVNLYRKNEFLLKSGLLNEEEKEYFYSIRMDMDEEIAAAGVWRMSEFLFRYYGKKVIILLDEYDTPMQEAYVNGYWEKLTNFTRNMFNSMFKTNPYLERGLMTGITRIGKESIFSDLNNLVIVTTTSHLYENYFGFTEREVMEALKEYRLEHTMPQVKLWYDGFTFGRVTDIYNPWSIINYLKTGVFAAYWANTSSNNLAGKLIREGTKKIKLEFEQLYRGEALVTEIDEQIVYSQLAESESAIWSLLLAGGYLKIRRHWMEETPYGAWRQLYELELTNAEIRSMFSNMMRDWFSMPEVASSYNDFIKALLLEDVQAMNVYMNRVALSSFSYFDTSGKTGKQEEPERFYHGFVLGLMVELSEQYALKSNRESGLGRYDILLEPRKEGFHAIIIEFKVFDPNRESCLSDTVKRAHAQIEEKQYDVELRAKGFSDVEIKKYGFAFRGKQVLIG